MGWLSAREKLVAREDLVWVGRVLAVGAGYVGSAMLAIVLAPSHPDRTFAWTPVGVGIVALWLGGARLWPAIAVSTLAITAGMLGRPPIAALGTAVSHTLAIVCGVAILRKSLGFRASLDRFQEMLTVVLAGVTSSAVDGFGGVASLALGGVLPEHSFVRFVQEWSVSSLLGVLVWTPVLLRWAPPRRVASRYARLAEATGLAVSLLVLITLLFGEPRQIEVPSSLRWPYLLFLPVMWATARFGTLGAVSAMVTIAASATAGTEAGRGVFGGPGSTASLAALHLFLSVTFLGALLVGSLVSANERSRAALSESASLLRAVVEGTTDAIYVKDRHDRYLMANAPTARFLGLQSAEALIGKETPAVISPEQVRRLHELDEEIMRTGRPQTFETSTINEGTTRIFQTAKAPYRDSGGEVIGVIAISRDVTEQRSAELTRSRLAAIVESSSDAIIGEALDGTITSWNAAATRLFGYAAEEVLGRPISILFAAEVCDEFAALLNHARRGELLEQHEVAGRRKDGILFTVALTLSPVRGTGGEVVGTSVIARDLADTAERLRLALKASKLGMWFWTVGSDRVSWTPLCRTIHGTGPDEEESYARWLSALHPDDRAPLQATLERAIRDRAEFRVEYRVVWPDGTLHWVSSCGCVYDDEAGMPTRVLGSVLDITQQKQADEERAELLDREQAAAAEKDMFLAILSHELRTPLQAMLGWTMMLRSRPRDAATLDKGLASIERAARAQTQLIEDLLDVSRIVAGKLRMDMRPVDLAEVVDAVLETVKLAAAARSIHVEEAIERQACVVRGDPYRLQQVVSNLLTNAIKFTPSGGRVGVRLERRGATARITVEDSGVGISPPFLPHVFDRFRQANHSISRTHGGLGLGLAIARHLVEAHGGSVQAESPGEGRGSTFTVTLPRVGAEVPAVAEVRAGREPSVAPLGGVRVLVVDDDLDARELFTRILREAGAEVRAVDTVRAALDALRSFRPDVLVSDIGMPEEDGYALIRELRAREGSQGGHVPALALTAFACSADRERALALGFEAHLQKPASPSDITTLVASLAVRPRAASP